MSRRSSLSGRGGGRRGQPGRARRDELESPGDRQAGHAVPARDGGEGGGGVWVCVCVLVCVYVIVGVCCALCVCVR